MAELISYEPATGAELWRGAIGDVDAEVADARARAGPTGRRSPLTFRIETLRRFANVVRAARRRLRRPDRARDRQAAVGSARPRSTAVIAKVDISVTAYAERTAQRRLEAPMGSRMALRHKPHGVLAVLGPV